MRVTVIDKLGRCEQSGLWATIVVSIPDFTFVNRETKRRPAVGKILSREPKTASPGCSRTPTETCDYRSRKMIMVIITILMVIIITKTIVLMQCILLREILTAQDHCQCDVTLLFRCYQHSELVK